VTAARWGQALRGVAAALALTGVALLAWPVSVPGPMEVLATLIDVRQGATVLAGSRGDTVDAARLVAGNVFTPARRGVGAPTRPSAAAGARPRQKSEGPAPNLIGTVMSGGRLAALLDLPGSTSGASLIRPGESVGGWRLEEVSESTAVVSGVAGRRVLRLGRGNKGES